MKRILGCFVAAASLGAASLAMGDVLEANTDINNGGSAGWGMFFDLTSNGPALSVTGMKTASTAAAGAQFTVEIFTRSGSGLGNPGPGQSSDGWTSLGTAQATQGPVSSGISEEIDIPDIAVGGGETVGVAVIVTVSGPRYFGTGSPPHQIFSDSNLTLTTGDSRSVPFTSGGSFFSSRGLSGSLTYSAGGGGYTCTVSGDCPGTVVVSWDGAQPDSTQGIVFSTVTGNFVVPNGPCQGTELGLGSQGIRLVRTVNTGSGAGSVTGQAGTPACGGHIQLVTIGSPCEASTVGNIP